MIPPETMCNVEQAHRSHLCERVLYATACANVAFSLFAHWASLPEKQTFENLVLLTLGQIGIAFAIVWAGIRLKRLHKFDAAFALVLFLASGHSLIPIALVLAGKYRGTSLLAAGQVVFATYWWCVAVLLVWVWWRNSSREREIENA